MTLLDDHDLDDVLHGFRADEGRLDEAARARIWARIGEVATPAALDALDEQGRQDRHEPTRLRHRRPGVRPRGRVLAVAAAVLALLAVAGLTVRSGPDDGSVTAGPPSTGALPRDLQELADTVALLPATALGSSPDAAYTFRRGIRSFQSVGSSEVTTWVERHWVALDGTGRVMYAGDDTRDERVDEPGTLTLGQLDPAVAIGLPDDADAVIAAIEARVGPGTFGPTITPGLVEILTYTGLPGPARAGVLRALDRAGFVPVPAPDLGPTLWRVEGPGPEGATMQADLDLATGSAVATLRSTPGNGITRLRSIETDLRAGPEGS